MIERALLILALVLAVIVVVLAVRGWAAARSARLKAADADALWSALGERANGQPALLVFSTPSCIACRTTQAPAVREVGVRFGDALRVFHVDISKRPAVARAFKVLTAPSSAVLDPAGRVVSLNHGFAPSELLASQVNAAIDSPASAPSLRRPGQRAHAAPVPADRR